MTDAEIYSLDLPMMWYKDALKALRDKENHRKYAEVLNASMGEQQYVPDPSGTMAVWEGDDAYMQMSSGSLILVHYGKLLWIADEGGFWFETSYSRYSVGNQARRLKRCTKTEYTAAYKEKLLAQYGHVPFTVVDDSSASPVNSQSAVLSRYGVRISNG